jgi:hypothetical protein
MFENNNERKEVVAAQDMYPEHEAGTYRAGVLTPHI